MNKAPVTQPQRRSVGFFGRRKDTSSQVLPVAQPLTEEEAVAEIARARADEEAVRQARQDKILRKEAEKAARIAAKEARRAAKLAARSQTSDPTESVQVAGGRFVFSLSTAACVGLIGLVSAIVLGAYVYGQRAARQGNRLSTVAATTGPVFDATTPLLPPQPESGAVSLPLPDSNKASTASTASLVTDNPDLAHLLQRPVAADSRITPNQPARVDPPSTGSVAKPESLNYLQIESFVASRDRTREQLAQDLDAVRRFLNERGVRTFARKRNNGYVLFAEEGFPPGKETKRQREAFIRKLEQLGTDYRGLGGQYQFKGCFFVSYGSTQAGDPV